MSTEIIMPQMGESIFEGTITKWLKAIGDTVAIDEPLFEISTDKVDAEIPSPVAGVLAEIRFPEGATIEVNTVVAVIGEAGSGGPQRLRFRRISSKSLPHRRCLRHRWPKSLLHRRWCALRLWLAASPKSMEST